MIKKSVILILSIIAFATVKSNCQSSVNSPSELLTPKNILFNTSLLDTFYFKSPYPIASYTKEEIDIQHNIHSQMNTSFVYTYSPVDDSELYQENNYELPIELRNIDNEPITPYTWKVIKIKVLEANGNELIATLKRPNWWIKHHKADKLGNKFHIAISDMNISGEAEVLKIQGQQIDTRIETFKGEGDYKYRPVTGKFERIASKIYDYEFSTGDVIGSTPNHPYYSEDKQQYIPIGEFSIGEKVKLSNNKVTTLISKSKRQKGEETVYNLEVYRDHNFHVGNEGLLVHNSCLIGEILETTANWFKYKNYKGFVLKINKMTPANVEQAIKRMEKSTATPGQKTQASAARAVQQKKEVKTFDNGVTRQDGNPAGDIDIETADEIIEVKKSLNAVKTEQIKKYANFEHNDFMNPNAKKVVLYIEDASTNVNHPTLNAIREMNNQHGIAVEIVIGSLDNLKNALK